MEHYGESFELAGKNLESFLPGDVIIGVDMGKVGPFDLKKDKWKWYIC